jgi:hypothetical protein
MYRTDLPHLAWCLDNLAQDTPVNLIKVAPDGRLGANRTAPHARSQ